MIDPTVRSAVAADAATLRDLEREARDAVADTRGGRRWLDEHREIGDGWSTAIIEGGVFVAVIPTDDPGRPVARPGGVHADVVHADVVANADVVVGVLVADLRHDPMAILHIDQVFVTPDARELGFGDGLLAAAIAWGRQAGAELIEGHSLPGDRNLKNLYERAGITARLITVSKRL